MNRAAQLRAKLPGRIGHGCRAAGGQASGPGAAAAPARIPGRPGRAGAHAVANGGQTLRLRGRTVASIKLPFLYLDFQLHTRAER